ncbi:uncharacterized protein CCOS01_16422 [Colletotrichum costaricense]|uniref:Uncharacterized protein n=1 Tax=Colletotrichum costaricense TaxID=1209916 RepID=A0AAI9YFQ3_9PEZI|nr:uncharacterized protein CCOS01_16422 [Colletotrichum costaricense]KAK1506563.1 hypothetical protein CCOS01_16422 [Colletotrichum costaricense]
MEGTYLLSLYTVPPLYSLLLPAPAQVPPQLELPRQYKVEIDGPNMTYNHKPYFHTVTTSKAFLREPQQKENWLESLDEEWSNLPAFNFDSKNRLPSRSAFWQDHGGARAALERLVQGPEPSDNINRPTPRSEYALQKAYGTSLGSTWAALNRDASDDNDDAELAGHGTSTTSSPPARLTPEPEKNQRAPPPLHSSPESLPEQRRSKRTRPNNTVTNTYEPLISSSPSVSTKQPSSPPYINEEESVVHPALSEDLTHRFASAFIRHILYNTPTDDEHHVDFDDHRLSLKCRLESGISYTSIDDGGLLLVADSARVHGRIAILEAKRNLASIDSGRHILTDERFAQLIGQALAIAVNRPQKWAGLQHTIFMIAASRYYMQFFEVCVSPIYLDQLQIHSLHQDENADFIRVHATEVFDLKVDRGRQHAVKNLAATEWKDEEAYDEDDDGGDEDEPTATTIDA